MCNGGLKSTAGASSPPALASLPGGPSLMQGSPHARMCPRLCCAQEAPCCLACCSVGLGCGCVWVPLAPFPKNHKSERRGCGLGKGLGLKGQDLECVCVCVCVCPGAGPYVGWAPPGTWGPHRLCGAYICPRSLGLPSHGREQVPAPHLPGPFWALPHAPSPWSLLGPKIGRAHV